MYTIALVERRPVPPCDYTTKKCKSVRQLYMGRENLMSDTRKEGGFGQPVKIHDRSRTHYDVPYRTSVWWVCHAFHPHCTKRFLGTHNNPLSRPMSTTTRKPASVLPFLPEHFSPTKMATPSRCAPPQYACLRAHPQDSLLFLRLASAGRKPFPAEYVDPSTRL